MSRRRALAAWAGIVFSVLLGFAAVRRFEIAWWNDHPNCGTTVHGGVISVCIRFGGGHVTRTVVVGIILAVAALILLAVSVRSLLRARRRADQPATN